LSASTSCKEVLAAIRRGERPPLDVIRHLGEEHAADFFRLLIEPLGDSFDASDVAAYTDLMSVWVTPPRHRFPEVPPHVDSVYVLSRVTLGADVKITSTALNALKQRFPAARIALVSNSKSAELFGSDSRIEHFNAAYPRSGPVSSRIQFAVELKRRLAGANRIVVDPDSRMTQLGLIPVCEPEHYFHFPSRTANRQRNLTQLTQQWLRETFRVEAGAYIAPAPVAIDDVKPQAAVSFGVGENDSKRMGGDFEARVIEALGRKFARIWIDRGVGGEEAQRVTNAAANSKQFDKIRFWEGSFAGFASIVSQCDFYAGYDSAGQHVAAAAGVPLVTFFKGACSTRFRDRWSPSGPAEIHVIDCDCTSPEDCLKQFALLLE